MLPLGVEAWDDTLGQTTGTWDREGQATGKDTIHTEVMTFRKLSENVEKILKTS